MAAWLPDPIEHTAEAGWLAFLLTLAGAWWKARLRMRADAREDHEDEASSRTIVAAAEANNVIIEQLRAAVTSMSQDFAALREQLATARRERDDALVRAWNAESAVARLTARVGVLEDRVRYLENGAAH